MSDTYITAEIREWLDVEREVAISPSLRELKIITYPTPCEQGEYPQTIFPNPIGAQSVFQSCSGLLA